MNCFICNCTTNDGVQCSVCKKHLCYSCGGITESGYRKLGSDRRGAWKCPQCKLAPISVPSPKRSISSTEAASLELVLTEIRDMKRQIANLCAVVDEFKELKREVSELKASSEFTSGKLDEYEVKFTDIERKISEVSKLQHVVMSTQNAVAQLTANVEAAEQWARQSNVEVRGVPLKKDENLFSIVEGVGKTTGYPIMKSQLNYISRVPTYSKEKNIVVSFINRYVKEEFIAAARAFKVLKASDIGFNNNTQRIYINDHLTPASKNLLNKAKKRATDLGYMYKWVKFGKIHIRKNDSSPVIVISSEGDLNKLV
jgi:hypothetical protein